MAAKKIADRMHFPFYFTSEQWNTVMNKLNFKHLCMAHGVPVPQEFVIEDIDSIENDSSIQYPVIVKPVDEGAAVGVHICRNTQELKAGYLDAKEKSKSRRVVAEKYITGQEISVYFVFVNGEGRLSCVSDKYICRQDRGYTPLPEAYVLPSKSTGRLSEEVSAKIISMFKAVGFDTGVFCVQGIANSEGIFIFECCFRLTGVAMYRFVERINGNSYMQLMTDKMILGSADYDLSKENPTLNGKHCCSLSLLSKGGTVGSISGYEEVCGIDGVISVEKRYDAGDEITTNGTLRQTHFQIFMICDTLDELKALIETIKHTIHVTDTDGNNMLYSDFDTELLG